MSLCCIFMSLYPDVPLRQVVGEECVTFMLNWRENDYLTMQVPPSLVMNNPYIKVKSLFFHSFPFNKNTLIYGIKGVVFVCFSYFLPTHSLVSSWPQLAKSSQVLRRVAAQPKNCGRWWCRYAASPSSTRETVTAGWAWLNTESLPWASCSGTS